MGFPVGPWVPILMTALQPLIQQTWAGRLPTIAAGASFWALSRDTPALLASGQARLWQAGDPPAPQAEPAWTAHGSPGFGAGTSNCSH